MAGACRWLGHVADRVVALERRVPLLATRESLEPPEKQMAGAWRWLGHVADRVVALERCVPLLATRERSSTPPVVPGAAPALAKAGVGVYIYIMESSETCICQHGQTLTEMLVSDETRCAMQQHSVADIDIEVVSLKNQMTKGDSSLRLGSFGLNHFETALRKAEDMTLVEVICEEKNGKSVEKQKSCLKATATVDCLTEM